MANEAKKRRTLMWIQGRRRGGAKSLARHLQKPENEAVRIHDIEGFAFDDLFGGTLDKALKQMEATGYGKGNKRNLYHAILAPAYGETLSDEQRKTMIAYYIDRMGFQGLQYCAVEHWKKGKQHFHLVFNIIHPITGKIDELKWTKRKEWQISRDLEHIFGHKSPTPKGKSAHPWEMQRGTRQGIDPRKMRKEVTAIFNQSQTTKDFIANLEKAKLTLTRSDKNKLVLVDKAGDIHGLMRRIEGKKLADLRQKFSGIEKTNLPDMAETIKARQRTAPKAGRSCQKYIAPQKVRTPVQKASPTSQPQPHKPALKTTTFTKAAKSTTNRIDLPKRRPAALPKPKKGWPLQAVIDWEAWGHAEPQRFFFKWPDLAPDGFVFSYKPNR